MSQDDSMLAVSTAVDNHPFRCEYGRLTIACPSATLPGERASRAVITIGRNEMSEQIELGLTTGEAAALRILAVEAISDRDFVYQNDLIAAASFIGPRVRVMNTFPNPTFNLLELEILIQLVDQGSLMLGDKLDGEKRKAANSAREKIAKLAG